MQVGKRKLVVTLSYTSVSLGLGFIALLLDKLSGAEFISAVQATGAVVGSFVALNVAGKVWGGDKSP